MNSRHYLSVVLFLSFLFIHATIQADTLYLKDGSTLFGKVGQLDSELTFTPTFGDEISIDWEKVAGLSTDSAHSVELSDGRRIEGQFVYSPVNIPVPGGDNKGAWQLKKGDGTVVSVEADDLKMIWDAGSKDPKTIKNETKWTVRVTAGIDGETGTSEQVNLNTSIDIKRETPQDTLIITGSARYSQEGGEITTNEIIGGAEYNWNFTERTAAYIKSELERDRFENINFRSTTTAGIAYKVFTKDKFKWTVQAGAGVQYEEQIGGIQDSDPVLEFTETLFYQLNEYLEFHHKVEYIPVLENFGDDYRIDMENDVIIPITLDKAWQIRLGIRNSYNKNPGGGADKLDTFYYLNLVWDVK